MPVQPSRRSVLRAVGLGAAGGLLTACTGGEPTPPPAPPTADEEARAAAARLELDLAGLAGRTAQRHPDLTVAAAAAAAHTAHAAALRETLGPAASPSATSGPPAVTGARATAARALASAERDAAHAHRAALAQTEVTGDLARLLASVAGSDDGFAVRLRAAAS